jgi:single-stranded DNA-binding protein
MPATALIQLFGHVNRPEIRETKAGPLLKFAIPVNRREKNASGEWVEADPTWYNVCVFKPQEWLVKKVIQGALVSASGEFYTRQYVDKNGEKRTECCLDFAKVTHLAEPKDRSESAPSPRPAAAAVYGTAATVPAAVGQDEPPF